MRTKIWFIFLFLIVLPARAEEFSLPDFKYPKLENTVGNIQSFIPEGWLIEEITFGDLNNDGADDVVLILRYVGLDTIITYGNNNEEKFDTKPRMVVILFKDKIGYKFIVQNNDIIPQIDNDTIKNDPLDNGMERVIDIKKNILSITIEFFENTVTTRYTWTYRYQNEDFKLIGFDSFSLHRPTGRIDEYSYNFLTGKCGVSVSDISEVDQKWAWGKVPVEPLLNFADTDELFDSDLPHCKTSFDEQEDQ